MLHFRYLTFIILFFLSFTYIKAEEKINTNLSYEEIEKNIDELHDEPEKMWKFINLYISNSKKNNDQEALVYAYRYASNFSKFPKNIKYSDSALAVSKLSGDKKLMTNAYINRGIVFMNQNLFQNAIDDILKANKLASDINDQYTLHKTIYFLAQNKIYLGLYQDANKELKSCITYFKNNINKKNLGVDFETYYLYSLMSYIDSNTRLGKQEKNKALIEEGIAYITNNNQNKLLPYFISIQGTDAFYQKDYKTAEVKLQQALKLFDDQWTHITEIYYLGLTYWNTDRKKLAIKYFEEIDKEYNKTNKIDPQFRAAYEILIKHNDSIGNTAKQLEYINKLMSLDKSYEKHFRYLYPKINKEYDTKKLIAEKTKIEKSLKNQKLVLISIVIISILIITLVVYRYFKLKKFYKQRFEEILAEEPKHIHKIEDKIEVIEVENESTHFISEDPVNSTNLYNKNIEYYSKIPGMKPMFVESILQQLDDFEKQEQFLDPQVTQRMLSEKFGTNSTYLSRIINTYKGKKFTNYVNDLRLEYTLEHLKSDYNFLNMDVKELSNIAGFSSSENFSDNFQRKYKIKPSYFIKMMKEKFHEENL